MTIPRASADASAGKQSLSERLCTCHLDDNPPRPCPQKFAFGECMRAALDAKDTKIEKLRSLIQCLIDNEPDHIAADGGITVFDVWRKEALATIHEVVKPWSCAANLREAADSLDEMEAEIERLREALRNVDAKVLEDLDRATRNRGARVAT